jgi:hypothetical protein
MKAQINNEPFPPLSSMKSETKLASIIETREQTQEEIIDFIEAYGFLSHPEFLKENLGQIVVDNFKKLENKILT